MKVVLSLLIALSLTGCTASQIRDMNRGLEKRQAQPGYYTNRSRGNPYTKNFVSYPNYTPAPISTPQVNFGSGNTSTYQPVMINTDSGIKQKRCKTLNSGYVYCF